MLQPNACSSNGLCGAHDECFCDPGYLGADCSQQACPFGSAFIDTPRGDLNHNGIIDVGTAGYTPVQWSYALEPEYYPIALSGAPSSTVPYYSVPLDPAGGEAHFWQECSGKGTCNPTAGESTCFAGYTGAACEFREVGPGGGGGWRLEQWHVRVSRPCARVSTCVCVWLASAVATGCMPCIPAVVR